MPLPFTTGEANGKAMESDVSEKTARRWGKEREVERVNTLWSDAWRRLKKDRAAVAGAVICLLLIVLAFFAPWIAPYDPNWQHPHGLSATGAPLPPCKAFWLGTDNLGRDVLSRLIWGARVSLFVGIVGNGLAVIIALLVGATAAFFGGWVETVLMRITDVMMAFPTLLLAIALGAVLRPGIDILIVIIALVYWVYLARIVHGRVLSLREMEFVLAARVIGASRWRILTRHILPHLVSVAVVYATLGVASTVLMEAELSYLGLGIRLPTASWGGMISEGQTYYRSAPWLILSPGLMLMLTVLGFNLMGDGLRDALDPQQRR
ncbi:MAG: ABC transporter permease [Chloroflexia bacterium]